MRVQRSHPTQCTHLSGDSALHVVGPAPAEEELVVELEQECEEEQLCLPPARDGIPSLQALGGDAGEGEAGGELAREVCAGANDAPPDELKCPKQKQKQKQKNKR